MNTSPSTINWVTLGATGLSVNPGSNSSPYQLSGTLGIVRQDGSNFFSMSGNALQISAPQNTPVQISWQQAPAIIVNGNTVSLYYTGINYSFAGNLPTPLGQEYPVTLVSPSNGTPNPTVVLNTTATPVALSLSGLAAGALTTVCLNTLPAPKNGEWVIDYTLIFQGSDGNVYQWDPPDDIEHMPTGHGGGGIVYKRPSA